MLTGRFGPCLLAILVLAAPTGDRAGAQSPITGELPREGYGLVVWAGGSTAELVAAAGARGCALRSAWVTRDGVFIGFVPGAPDVVNTWWRALFPGDIPASTALIVVCGGEVAGRELGALPRGWPARFELGLTDGPGGAAARAAEGLGLRYQYLAGGANSGEGWATWNRDGTFVTRYVDESVRAGIVPVFTYYTLRQSLPGAAMGEATGVAANVVDASTMRAYYEDLRLFLQRAGETDAMVVLHVEPDFWGYLQQGNPDEDATGIRVLVGSSGVPDVSGLPDTLAGFAQALVRLRDRYAPNVLLGYALSVWGANVDISIQDPPDAEVDGLAAASADFYRSLGADFDLVFSEFSDRDAAFKQLVEGDGTEAWWGAADFERFARYLGGFHRATGERIVLWQIPLGNTKMRAMDNTWHHYQDNRVEWLLDDASGTHLRAYIDAGVIALLFGGGASGTTCACDAAGDGVTDPAPINGNDRASLSADDDGGYFKERVRAFYGAGATAIPAP